jgi:hypothetical protein
MEGSMKKLFVLFLCLAAVAGFVSAGTVHPPGENSPALSGYGVGYEAVTPDTVLITAKLAYGLPDQILAVYDMMCGLPGIVVMMTMHGMILPGAITGTVDYPLRL